MENTGRIRKVPVKRRWRRILLRSLSILFVLALSPVVLVQIPAIQTAVVHKVTESLSQKLGVEIKVESVGLSLFSGKVSLRGIYVEDPLKDTLLYVGRLRAGVTQLPLFGKQLAVGIWNCRTEFSRW